jgi:hypothetical protein
MATAAASAAAAAAAVPTTAAAVTPAVAWRLAIATGAGTQLPAAVTALIKERASAVSIGAAAVARRGTPLPEPVRSLEELFAAVQTVWATMRPSVVKQHAVRSS